MTSGIDNSGVRLSSRDVSGVRSSSRDVFGVRSSSRDVSGIRLSSRDNSGVRLSSRDVSGVRSSSRDVSGVRSSSRDVFGVRSSSRDVSGVRLSSRDNSGLVIDVCDTVTSVLVVVVSLSPTHFLLSHSFNTASSLNGCNTSFTLFGPVFTVDLSNLKLAVVFPSVEISVASIIALRVIVMLQYFKKTSSAEFQSVLPSLS
ncbi:hypothetical protein MSG28_009005 [Choristoneura fumiferana]|uniref:Uncharacterized protein n=1 Tax=Choristoneura fumiferana TaxID=7141 RepID=A0ACC0J8U4_CHOFU|nr:hypothetical protein MSG28_009005 [Choristoneura fumiferana]